MKVTRLAETPDEPFDNGHFSGPVTRRDFGSVDHPAGTALIVSFPAGARTDWHSHPDGQVLYVVEGSARVGTRDGTVERVAAGDMVVAPPDEEHWHGAAEDAPMRHLALSFGETAWLEPVEER